VAGAAGRSLSVGKKAFFVAPFSFGSFLLGEQKKMNIVIHIITPRCLGCSPPRRTGAGHLQSQKSLNRPNEKPLIDSPSEYKYYDEKRFRESTCLMNWMLCCGT